MDILKAFIKGNRLLKTHEVDKDRIKKIATGYKDEFMVQVHKTIESQYTQNFGNYTCYNILEKHDMKHTVPFLAYKTVRYNSCHRLLAREPLRRLVELAGIKQGDLVHCYYALDTEYHLKLVKVVFDEDCID